MLFQNILAYLIGGGGVPEAMRTVADAFMLCLASPQHYTESFPYNMGSRNDFPNPETCGDGPPGGSAFGLAGSKTLVSAIASFAFLFGRLILK